LNEKVNLIKAGNPYSPLDMRNTMLVSTVDLEEIPISKQVKGGQHGNSQFIKSTIVRRTLSR
jgi:hypothetical protein